MNIVSVTVSAAMMGTLMPGIMTMAIAPTVAQVRSNNFAVAEAQTVAFAANAKLMVARGEAPKCMKGSNSVKPCSEGLRVARTRSTRYPLSFSST